MPPQPPMGSRKNAGAASHGIQTAAVRGGVGEAACRGKSLRDCMAGEIVAGRRAVQGRLPPGLAEAGIEPAHPSRDTGF